MNKILKRFKELIGGDQKNSIKEIKYFSPTEQKTMPNGSYYQRGGFIGECVKNSKSFITDNYEYLIDVNGNLTEAIHHTQYGLSDYRGGIIVFSTDINSIEISKNRIINWAKQRLVSLKNRFFSKKILTRIISDYNLDDEKKIGDKEINDYIGAFSIGNFFSGRYFDDNGDMYDENSQTIEVNGISSEGLIFLAEEICKEFQQETVLVKDLNLNKIFLVNPYKSDDYNLSDINKKVGNGEIVYSAKDKEENPDKIIVSFEDENYKPIEEYELPYSDDIREQALKLVKTDKWVYLNYYNPYTKKQIL